MVQTARIHETPPQGGETGISADQAAWNSAARARKFRVHDNVVWIFHDGALAPLPAIEGFAGLSEKARGLVFQAVAQFLRYRVGQTLSGNSLSGALAKAIAGDVPDAKSNDAFEDAYAYGVERRVTLKLGELPALPEKPTAEEAAAAKKAAEDRKATVAASIENTQNRAKLFDACVSEAIARGESTAAVRETARKPKAAKAGGIALD